MDKRTSVGLVLGLVVISLALAAFFYAQTQTDDPLLISGLSGPMKGQTKGQTFDPRWPQQALLSADTRGQSAEKPPAGHWGRYAQGKLQPSADLRARFDQLLAQRGDQPLSNMRNTVQALATQDLGPDGGLAVAMLWDRYLSLLVQDEAAQNSVPTHAETPEQWIASRLIFFTQARTSLGPEWGDVLFAEEEAQIRQLAKSMEQLRLKTQAGP